MNNIVSDLAGLSPQERLQLIEWLWDSLDDSDVPVTQAQRDELSRRIASFDDEKEHAVAWDALRAELRKS